MHQVRFVNWTMFFYKTEIACRKTFATFMLCKAADCTMLCSYWCQKDKSLAPKACAAKARPDRDGAGCDWQCCLGKGRSSQTSDSCIPLISDFFWCVLFLKLLNSLVIIIIT